MQSQLDPSLTLTERKVAILRHLAAGRSIQEIAEALGISVATVCEHMVVIRQRLGAHTNPELVRIGIRHGFIPADEGRF